MTFEVNGLNELIKKFNTYSKSLSYQVDVFLERLSALGYDMATYKYDTAIYDGVNDVQMMIEFENNAVKLIANGTSVLFIEFGTGIVFTEEHPYSVELGFTRGMYGKGKGSLSSWTYIGEPGSNGRVVAHTKTNENVVRTSGNPPANAMYEAGKVMRDSIIYIAEEVFKFG